MLAGMQADYNLLVAKKDKSVLDRLAQCFFVYKFENYPQI